MSGAEFTYTVDGAGHSDLMQKAMDAAVSYFGVEPEEIHLTIKTQPLLEKERIYDEPTFKGHYRASVVARLRKVRRDG